MISIFNYLGVNPPLTPPKRGSQEDRVRREEIRRKSSKSSRRETFLFTNYPGMIHTSNNQRLS
ncbi:MULTISPECIES: hypothetical protein [Okeania]|uniref:hypothetical protein n=1 Tax=Okeania TaxID=1458928 RepID=UPI000F51E6C5|nr:MULTISPECIES: hypothetical protein [Okeania]NET76814.1 hypothetical protein [Okeania sp. SIO1F9]